MLITATYNLNNSVLCAQCFFVLLAQLARVLYIATSVRARTHTHTYIYIYILRLDAKCKYSNRDVWIRCELWKCEFVSILPAENAN